MNPYSSLADDFSINMNLATEMDLPSSREAVLHYFEQIQKQYPAMRNFYAREKNDFILEEDKDRASYRWCSIEPRRISSGMVNPPTIDDALQQHRLALEHAPYTLSVSPLDCEALDLMMGFDFTCRGNHSQLIAEALGVCPALERLAGAAGRTVINYEPSFTFALDDECRIQCRFGVEPRTNAYQIRTGEFQEEQLSVYVTARQYGSLPPGQTFVGMLDKLWTVCQDMVDNYVIDAVLQPLARTIAME